MKIVPIWLCLCIVMIIVACSSPNQVNIVEESGSNGADLEGANNDFYGIKLIPFGMFRSSSPKYPSLADSGWEYVWVLLSVTNDSDSLLYYSPPPLDEVKLRVSEGYQYDVVEASVPSPMYIPPGLRIWGNTGYREWTYFVFKVAPNVTPTQINIPSQGLVSLENVPAQITQSNSDFLFSTLERNTYGEPEGFTSRFKGGQSYNQTEFVPTDYFPSILPVSAYVAPNSPISINENVEISIIGVSREFYCCEDFDQLSVRMNYRNLSGGYGATFDLGYFILGNTGILREARFADEISGMNEFIPEDRKSVV